MVQDNTQADHGTHEAEEGGRGKKHMEKLMFKVKSVNLQGRVV